MKLSELKERVDHAMKDGKNYDLVVCIPNNKPSMGPLATTEIKWCGQGIDWDHDKFFIWPVEEMTNVVKQ